MGRLLLYLAIGFIIWRIVRALVGRPAPSQRNVAGPHEREQRIDPPRGPEIDYSKVRDAEYRELRSRRTEGDAGYRSDGGSDGERSDARRDDDGRRENRGE